MYVYISALCPCPKNLSECKLKSNRQIPQQRKISRLRNVESVGWFLFTSLMQACSIKSKWWGRKIQTVHCGEEKQQEAWRYSEGWVRRGGITVKDIWILKKRPGLHWSERRGTLRVRPTWMSSHSGNWLKAWLLVQLQVASIHPRLADGLVSVVYTVLTLEALRKQEWRGWLLRPCTGVCAPHVWGRGVPTWLWEAF